MTVLAHFGHWYISMLYLAPVLIVVGALSIQTRRERRRGPDERDDELDELDDRNV
jgi:hypothetical protein